MLTARTSRGSTNAARLFSLPVNIIKSETARYVVLNNAAMPSLILYSRGTVVDSKGNSNATSRLLLGQNVLQQLTKIMDSENDKKFTTWLLTINMTRSQMREIGVDSQTNLQQTSKNLEIIEESENAVLAAEDLVKLRLQGQAEAIQRKLEEKQEKQNSKKRCSWHDAVIEECQDKIEHLQSHKQKLMEEIENPDSTSVSKTQQKDIG